MYEVRRLELGELLVRERVYPPGLRMPRHAHELSNVTVVAGGEIEESGPGGTHRGRVGSVVLKPAGCEHENRVSGFGARTVSIELRRGAVSSDVASRRWSWLEHAAVVRAAVALSRASDREVEGRAHELLAAVLTAPQGSSAGPSWLDRILDALHQHFDEPLRFEALARDHGLHPVYLSRAFHRHVGVTMHEYLRGLRVGHARHLLSASKRSMTAIAAESGFTDSAHLSRTFAAVLGLTPTSFRDFSRQVQGVQMHAAIAS